jgi:CDP-diacylglycerol--serine O-phosphatidyltransferase
MPAPLRDPGTPAEPRRPAAHRRGRARFLVPNLFTALNFLLGILAILVMHQGFAGPDRDQPTMSLGFAQPPLILAGWMIIWCTLLDKLDGFAARMLDASSAFGAQFDSLADLTAFGIAPGLLVYFYTQSLDPSWFAGHRPLMVVAVSFYMLSAAVRLARFNAVDSTRLVTLFQGLPSPFAGGIVVLSILLHAKHAAGRPVGGSIVLLPLLLGITGLLMVSSLYLPKLGRRKSRALTGFQLLNVLAGYVCGFGMIFPEYLLSLLIVYATVGFTWGLVQRGRLQEVPPAAPG